MARERIRVKSGITEKQEKWCFGVLESSRDQWNHGHSGMVEVRTLGKEEERDSN